MNYEIELQGHWKVRRISGFLPPAGVSKHIERGRGWTKLFGVPVASFRVQGQRLVYRFWPVVDDLERQPDGTFTGQGRLFGWPFCRFRLDRVNRRSNGVDVR
jgi:hypothetical protein